MNKQFQDSNFYLKFVSKAEFISETISELIANRGCTVLDMKKLFKAIFLRKKKFLTRHHFCEHFHILPIFVQIIEPRLGISKLKC